MNFQQFQKELQDRGIDKQLAYMLSIMYERTLDNAKQLDMCASIITALTETVQNFSTLHESTQGRLKELLKEVRGHVDGVSVVSEPGKGN